MAHESPLIAVFVALVFHKIDEVKTLQSYIDAAAVILHILGRSARHVGKAAEGEDGKENIKETLIWGTDNGDGTYSTRWLAIPASFNWEQGKKYTYTIVFGKDGGGFIPGGDPDPVFVPVTFDVTVDDFVTVNNKDKDIVIEQDEAEEEPEP